MALADGSDRGNASQADPLIQALGKAPNVRSRASFNVPASS